MLTYIYVLDYFNTDIFEIIVNKDITNDDVPDILYANGFKDSQCNWLISTIKLDLYTINSNDNI